MRFRSRRQRSPTKRADKGVGIRGRLPFRFGLEHTVLVLLLVATAFMICISLLYLRSLSVAEADDAKVGAAGGVDGRAGNGGKLPSIANVHEKSNSVNQVKKGVHGRMDVERNGNNEQTVYPVVGPEKLSDENIGQSEPRATIAYAVSLTSCGDESITDGGAVLKHSIHLSSFANPASGSRYGYKMYAIVHPSAAECSHHLQTVGYEILVRETPVVVANIKGKFLRERIEKNGCCGEKELIKFHAYTLLDHPVVVHLDLDTLILRPLDNLFDAMLEDLGSFTGKEARRSLPIMFGNDPPDSIEAYFTRDYNMKPAHRKNGLVQGGFLVLRPSQEIFDALNHAVLEGDFVEGRGWGGMGYIGYGSMTFQGLVPFFYDVIRPGYAVELDRCVYNNMCDNPRDQRTVNDIVSGKCRDGREECEDCRDATLESIFTTHFTLCQKPWHCLPQDQNIVQQRLCRKLHHEWFQVRKDLEESWSALRTSSTKLGGFQPSHFLGFCRSMGKKGYIRMVVPNSLRS